MPTAVVETLLEVAPVFANFSEQDRKDILEVAVEETYAPEMEIVSRGTAARSMYVVAEGTVEILESSDFDEHTVLGTLIPPCTFGELPFFERTDHAVTVRTITPVRVLSIERSGFDRLLERQSIAAYKLALNVLLKLGEQMRRIDEWIDQELIRSDPTRQEVWAEFRAKLYQGREI